MRFNYKPAALAAILGFTAGAASAQACSDRTKLVERLAAKYGEVFSGGGLRDSSTVFEIWMSEDTGTWTILVTQANGTACIMASGTNWRDGLPKEMVKGTAS